MKGFAVIVCGGKMMTNYDKLADNNITTRLTEHEKDMIINPRSKKEEEYYRMKALAVQYLRQQTISKALREGHNKAYKESHHPVSIHLPNKMYDEFKKYCGITPVNTVIKALMINFIDGERNK